MSPPLTGQWFLDHGFTSADGFHTFTLGVIDVTSDDTQWVWRVDGTRTTQQPQSEAAGEKYLHELSGT